MNLTIDVAMLVSGLRKVPVYSPITRISAHRLAVHKQLAARSDAFMQKIETIVASDSPASDNLCCSC
ncbi:hypothetical protein RBSH_00233 [Rhodopirellula baltica SH28]|uniref:Uncharacterized protein n=1 Tax=Rhodopirellula baltica SH28 TaxID=993517 RepID=K5DNA5_RHOBT|nr:hypothetical protein RBSH_00233 [Rhodopirellula baltica SH28]